MGTHSHPDPHPSTPADRLLRNALRANGAFSGLCGLSGALAAGALANVLGPPTAIVLSQGVMLLGFSLALFWLASRAQIPVRLALGVVVLDLLWVATTAAPLLASGELTPVGVPVVLVLATVVLGFAYFQYQGVQRVRGAAAGA